MTSLRDRLLDAPDDIDPRRLPDRFDEARTIVRQALGLAADAGIPAETVMVVLISETLPRLVDHHGPHAASHILGVMAKAIAEGLSPAGRSQ